MFRPKDFLEKNSDSLIYIITGLYFIIISTLTILKHITFHSNACDMALCDQIVLNILNCKGAYITFLKWNHLNEHLSLIFFLLAPFYIIYNSPVVLLVIQALSFSLTAIAIYFLAKYIIKDRLVALIFAFIYFISSQLLETIFFDFHPVSLLPFFLIFGFYSGLKKNYICYFICMLIVFSIREDMALYGVALGLYFLIVEKDKKIGIVTSLTGIIWFAIAIWYIHHGVMGTRYTYLGTNFISILTTIILHPLIPLKHILTNSIIPVLKLFSKMLFLPFFNLPALYLTVLPFSATMLSNYIPQYTLYAIYSVPILTFLYIASIYGFKKIYHINLFGLKLRNLILFMIIIINIFSLLKFIYIVDKRWFIKDNHVKIASIALSKIPKEVSVSAQTNFLPHLSRHEKNYLFPDIHDAEYIIIDTKASKWPLSEDKYFKRVRELEKDKAYNIIFSNDGIIIFRYSRK